MEKINATVYRFNDKPVFNVKQLWSVHEPSIEFDSKKHGDLAIVFHKDGTIGITYWSPRIPIDAENVHPARLVLQP